MRRFSDARDTAAADAPAAPLDMIAAYIYEIIGLARQISRGARPASVHYIKRPCRFDDAGHLISRRHDYA